MSKLDCAHLRCLITKTFARIGRAPTHREIAAATHTSVETVRGVMNDLARRHGVVLHPGTHDVWVAHPFSSLPTAYWVVGPHASYWGKCAWCSLGIAAMLKQLTRIHTRWGAEGNALRLDLNGHGPPDCDFVMHIAIPAAQWWCNVEYTCSTIHFFRSPDDVARWCKAHAIPQGEVLSRDEAWELARQWYKEYLDPRWKRKSRREAEAVFEQVGLTGDFWRLPDDWR